MKDKEDNADFSLIFHHSRAGRHNKAWKIIMDHLESIVVEDETINFSPIKTKEDEEQNNETP